MLGRSCLDCSLDVVGGPGTCGLALRIWLQWQVGGRGRRMRGLALSWSGEVGPHFVCELPPASQPCQSRPAPRCCCNICCSKAVGRYERCPRRQPATCPCTHRRPALHPTALHYALPHGSRGRGGARLRPCTLAYPPLLPFRFPTLL
jgi:hypothetical protein